MVYTQKPSRWGSSRGRGLSDGFTTLRAQLQFGFRTESVVHEHVRSTIYDTSYTRSSTTTTTPLLLHLAPCKTRCSITHIVHRPQIRQLDWFLFLLFRNPCVPWTPCVIVLQKFLTALQYTFSTSAAQTTRAAPTDNLAENVCVCVWRTE